MGSKHEPSIDNILGSNGLEHKRPGRQLLVVLPTKN